MLICLLQHRQAPPPSACSANTVPAQIGGEGLEWVRGACLDLPAPILMTSQQFFTLISHLQLQRPNTVAQNELCIVAKKKRKEKKETRGTSNFQEKRKPDL